MIHNISCKKKIQLQTLKAGVNVLTLGKVVLSCLFPRLLKEISEVLKSCQPSCLNLL